MSAVPLDSGTPLGNDETVCYNEVAVGYIVGTQAPEEEGDDEEEETSRNGETRGKKEAGGDKETGDDEKTSDKQEEAGDDEKESDDKERKTNDNRKKNGDDHAPNENHDDGYQSGPDRNGAYRQKNVFYPKGGTPFWAGMDPKLRRERMEIHKEYMWRKWRRKV